MKQQTTEDNETSFRIAPGVYLGVLMTPDEVARATADRDHPVYGSLHRWTLCGDVSPAAFDLLQALHNPAAVNERLTAFSSPAGHSYVVLTHQVSSYQHRYFVPLYDSKVRNCIEDITRNGALGYSLAGESHQALVWSSCIGARDFVPLKAMCGAVPEGEEEPVLEEYSRLLAEVRHPARIPSVVEGVTVRYASVTAIPPAEVMAQLARRYGVRE
ncbi:hypothetical protein ACPWT1_03065 [Ramlibacter sp. MMS24-I3-19]|uniref:hypothetical protein n=1 Tax=Ramlibacter sp. MMS24-I3-19 TaxID=3416606 RepID=UPI003D090DFF